MFSFILPFLATCTISFAQFPPTPTGITTRKSSQFPRVSISYKETCICETTAKAWAGYVRMPLPYTGINGDQVSLFFWYFEARNNPQNAPTTIYLAGGPGESSMYGVMSDGGPCTVLRDSNSTQDNPWSMNSYSNMLYIDNPVDAGFSYNALVKSTLNLLDASSTLPYVPFEAYNDAVPPQNSTFYYGLLPSLDPAKTVNSTHTAARALWEFSQVWFSEFPFWNTAEKRINLWGNSYGGFWTLITGQYFQTQNQKIRDGKLQDRIILQLDTVGFTNGAIDLLHQFKYYPEYLNNNTYGLEVISADIAKSATHNILKPGGCNDQIELCRQLGDEFDPDYTMNNASVNKICAEATEYCTENSLGLVYAYSKRSVFDIAHIQPDPFPSDNIAGFLNREWVQQELGVPVNFTSDAVFVEYVFFTSGDFVRVQGSKAMEYLLESGVKLALVYGDRDSDTPWISGEHVSLDVKWTGAEDFRNAGYEFVQVNDTYAGGLVRQHGNLSFTRVFQSGHDVAAYQPETNYQIFNRVILNKDIATGEQRTDGKFNNYSSRGPSSTWFHKETLPSPPDWDCYIYYANSCTVDQLWALGNGTAEIEEWYVVKPVGKIAGVTGNPIGSGAS